MLKKRFGSLLLILAIMLSSVSTLFVSAKETTEITDEDMILTQSVGLSDDEAETVTGDEAEVLPDATGDEASGGGSLPSSFDNSLSPYFPEVSGSVDFSDQKAINSTLFATIYYQFTFEMNKLRGVESTFENTFSPIFAYHILNKGMTDETALEDTYNFLENIGCATNATYPYYEKRWDSYDYWPRSKGSWREAIRYRMESSNDLAEVGDEDTQITSTGDEDLMEIKTNLVNGKLISFTTNYTSWDLAAIKESELAPENEKYVQNTIATEVVDVGYTTNTTWVLVGYNDDIWYDINGNNVVDSGEMGAFKAVSTRGKIYCTIYNEGFCWISYDALNKISAVEGVAYNPNREKAVNSMKTINVKAPDDGKDIYVMFELDYGVRSEFEVRFTAEGNGEKYEGRFLPNVNYLVKSDRYRFDNEIFIYSLKDLVPGLNNENFDEYDIRVTIEDYKVDDFRLKGTFWLVNEYNETECELHPDKLTVEGSSETVKVCNNTIIYYIGYDNPVLYYKTDEDDFEEVIMEESYAKRGYIYRYYIQDAYEAVLYFTDGEDKTDDNNGEYYKATTGFNYYKTEGQREPLEVIDFGLKNGLPDINTVVKEEELNTRNYKRSKYYVDFAGGYEPYYYSLICENLDTGEISQTSPWRDMTLFKDIWSKEGNYKLTVEITDWAGSVATRSIEVKVEDHPCEITSITPDKDEFFVSEAIEFRIDTNYMNMGLDKKVPRPTVTIKDSDDNIVWLEYLVECAESSYYDMTTTTYITFKPMKSGEYTMTVSVEDYCGEYAEKTITFLVEDVLTGDANGDGLVNIIDATYIQKYIAGVTYDGLYEKMADCNKDGRVNIRDATKIQKWLVRLDTDSAMGEAMEYTREKYTVKFENTFGWDEVYCQLITPVMELRTGWPGELMTFCEVNDLGKEVYVIEVPEGVSKLIFSNGVVETKSINFAEKDLYLYPIDNTSGSIFDVAEK